MTLIQAFLLPFLGHFALVLVLFAVLSWLRLAAVSAGEAKVGDFARPNSDPARSRRVARNLANQFEAPLFAYFAAALLVGARCVTTLDVVAAWVFLGGRLAHTLVQTLTDNVPLRGQVFTINFVAIIVLMAHVAWLVLSGSIA